MLFLLTWKKPDHIWPEYINVDDFSLHRRWRFGFDYNSARRNTQFFILLDNSPDLCANNLWSVLPATGAALLNNRFNTQRRTHVFSNWNDLLFCPFVQSNCVLIKKQGLILNGQPRLYDREKRILRCWHPRKQMRHCRRYRQPAVRLRRRQQTFSALRKCFIAFTKFDGRHFHASLFRIIFGRLPK